MEQRISYKAAIDNKDESNAIKGIDEMNETDRNKINGINEINETQKKIADTGFMEAMEATTEKSMLLPLGIASSLALVIGFLFGYIWFMYYGPTANFCEIKYVAQEELMDLEKERIARASANNGNKGGSGDADGKDLFFGQIDKAVTLTSQIAEGRKDSRTKIIYSISPVFNKDVQSISREVHSAVIASLQTVKD